MTKEQPDDAVGVVTSSEVRERQGDAGKAADACEQALKINPNLLPAIVRLAQLDAGPLQKPEAGLQLAKKARELSPTDPKIAGILGRLAFQTGNYAWADGLLQESARQATADPEVLHDSAWAMYSQGRVPDARQIMQRCLDRGATGPAAEDAKTFLFLTALPSAGSDLIKAEPEIGKALSSDPAYVPALMAGAALDRSPREDEGSRGGVRKGAPPLPGLCAS